METKTGYKALFGERPFWIVLCANVISRFGDTIDAVAYAWMVYALTGSKVIMGSLLAVNALPNLLFAAVSGVLADHLPKKRIVVLGHLGRGLVVSLTAALSISGVLEPWHLFALTFVNSTLETFSMPAHGALLPHLVDRKLYAEASGLSSSASTASQLAGLGAAGALIALVGSGGVILLDGITFFLAAAITGLAEVRGDAGTGVRITPSRWWADFKEGASFIRRGGRLVPVIGLMMFINFAIAPLNVLEAAYVKDVLHGGPELLSLFGVSLLAGMTAGGIAAGRLARLAGTWRTVYLGMLGVAAGYTAIGLPGLPAFPGSPIAFVAFGYCLAGFSVPLITTPLGAWIMGTVPQGILGRVVAAMSTLVLCAMPLGSSLSGAAAEIVPIPWLFVSMGILTALVVLPFLASDRGTGSGLPVVDNGPVS